MTLHLSPEEILARNKAKRKQWRLDHPERVKEFHRKYNEKPGVAERKKEWARANKDYLNAKRRETYRMKRLQATQDNIVPETTTESVEWFLTQPTKENRPIRRQSL